MKLIALKTRPGIGRTIHVGESFRVESEAEARKLVASGEASYLPGQEPVARAPAQDASKA